MTQPDNASTETPEAHVPSGGDYVSDRKFSDFPISNEVLKAILDLGYEYATPVQAATIEPALAGKDLVVRAKTGTGKTAAFCIPTIERLTDGARVPLAIILAPTRELAQQTAAESERLTAYRDLSVATLVGGLPIGAQEKALAAGAEIIVGTPGRVLDHIGRGNLDLSKVVVTCLDEADEMLSMGFFEDVTKIMRACPDDSQVLLFSATVGTDVERIVGQFLNDPQQIFLSSDEDQVEGISHILYETSPNFHKVRSLLHLLDIENPTSAIIFCNTREDTATVASFLDRQGLDVQILSGELPQSRRSQVMAKVKAGEVRYLVATDVAARGIDISDLSHVINYSLPQDAAVYMHRTGRTGRIGKKGTAISLAGGPDMGTRRSLESERGVVFELRKMPDAETCVQTRVDRQSEQIRKAMGTMVFEAYLPTVRALKQRPDGEMLLAAALRAFFQWDRARRAEASGIDTLKSLSDARNEKADRKRDRDRDRGGRRGDKRGRGRGRDDDRRDDRHDHERGEYRARSSKDDDDKPKRRRRKKKGGDGGGGASMDDLDALLSVDG